jgi:very-short-patch-repair endonuclease
MTQLPKGLHGAYRRSELVTEIGLPAVRTLLRDGRLVDFSRTVLVQRERLLNLSTRAAAALLFVGHGSVLTGHTAALLYGCSAADATPIHVLSSYQRKVARHPGLTLHHGPFEEPDVLELDGLRVIGLEIAIAELLCRAYQPVALACADQALAGLDPPHRERFRAEVARRIRRRPDPRGRRRAQVVLDLATGIPESPAESALLLKLYDAGLPIPELQYQIRDITGRERYRLDFAWDGPRVALEYDGREAHEDRADQDAARDADLRARGWTVIHATAPDLRNPARLITTIRAAITRRRFVA